MNQITVTESAISSEQDVTADLDRDQLMELVKDDASYLRPTLFTVYGVTKEGKPFIGWGIEFNEDEAIFYRPGSREFSISNSSEHILRSYQRCGDAHLILLDD